MKKIIRATERYFSDMGKIQSHFLFSFADYYDPSNMNWGTLRVFNDDFVAGKNGFPTHPHKHFEIVTIMLSGTVTHRDSLGNEEKIHAGEIQVTNTGSGISHSEFNEEEDNLTLFQLWFSPKNGVDKPSYYTSKIDETSYHNSLTTIASGIEKCGNPLITEASIKRGNFEKGQIFSYKTEEKRYILLYIISGKIQIDYLVLETRDQVRLYDEKEIGFEFLENSQIILIESK